MKIFDKFEGALVWLVLASASPAAGQSVPSDAPPITGASRAIVSTSHKYEVCWNGPSGAPFRWWWRPGQGATETGDATPTTSKCTAAFIRFSQTGNIRIDYQSKGEVHDWPSPPTKVVLVRWPQLTDTTGPYRIEGVIKRNGKVVGARTYRDVNEQDIVRLTNGVSNAAPNNVRVICSAIRDVRTGWQPRQGSRTIGRCKRV